MSIVVNKTRLPVTQWQTESGSIVSIIDARKRYAKSLSVALEPIQSGSGDPSPDNIRPISGRSSVTAYNDPKYGGTIEWNQMLKEANIVSSYSKFGLTFTRVTGKSGLTISGTFSYSSGDRNAYIFSGGINVPIVANHVYYASLNSAYANVYMYGATFTNNYVNNVPHGGSIVKASNSANLNMSLHFGSNIARNTEINETVYLNLFDLTEMFGESVANDVYAMDYANKGSGVAWFRNLFPSYDYEYNTGTETLVSAVNGDPCWNVSVSLGQTVYGGSVDLVSGVMTIDRAYLNHNTANMNNNDDYPGWRSSGVREIIGGGLNTGLYNVLTNISPIISSGHWAVGANTYGTTGDILMLNKLYFNKIQTEWKALAMDIQFVIPLATPQTIQLTAHQIEMLMRNNTVWSDAGVVTLEYARIRQ